MEPKPIVELHTFLGILLMNSFKLRYVQKPQLFEVCPLEYNVYGHSTVLRMLRRENLETLIFLIV